MAFRLIIVQHVLHVFRQRRIQLREPLCQILVYRGLADFEMFCRPAHRGLRLQHISRQLQHALFNIILHIFLTPFETEKSIGKYMRKIFML